MHATIIHLPLPIHLPGGLGANEVADGNGHGLGADVPWPPTGVDADPCVMRNGDESCERKRLLSLVYSFGS